MGSNSSQSLVGSPCHPKVGSCASVSLPLWRSGAMKSPTLGSARLLHPLGAVQGASRARCPTRFRICMARGLRPLTTHQHGPLSWWQRRFLWAWGARRLPVELGWSRSLGRCQAKAAGKSQVEGAGVGGAVLGPGPDLAFQGPLLTEARRATGSGQGVATYHALCRAPLFSHFSPSY